MKTEKQRKLIVRIGAAILAGLMTSRHFPPYYSVKYIQP